MVFLNRVETNDVLLKGLGDWYFLKSLSMAKEFPNIIENIFNTKKELHGKYSVNLHMNVESVEV
jgi:hypothetical protein